VGWYSVTPEEISVHVAKRCACNVIIDAFCGVGGNAIHFAKTCNFVIAVDLDPIRLACARHNASIYGVEHKIEFVLGSYLDVIPRANADVVFLAPPWGGPDYVHADVFDIDTMIPLHGSKLYQQTRAITPNICYQLPKNCDKKKVAQLARLGAIGVSNNLEGTDGIGAGVNAPAGDSVCEIEDNYLGESLKMMTAYFGNLVALS
jgi:trimethylguanosine synthase